MNELNKDLIVSKYYKLDPETETMLPNGLPLQNGMKVLIGTSDLRREFPIPTEYSPSLSEYTKHLVQTVNQWCVVSDLKFHNENLLSFVGHYDDGTVEHRRYSADYPWIVKKDSIPEDIQEITKPEIADGFEKLYAELNHVIVRAVLAGISVDEITNIYDGHYIFIQTIKDRQRSKSVIEAPPYLKDPDPEKPRTKDQETEATEAVDKLQGLFAERDGLTRGEWFEKHKGEVV